LAVIQKNKKGTSQSLTSILKLGKILEEGKGKAMWMYQRITLE
jgi:hypothetical protein